MHVVIEPHYPRKTVEKVFKQVYNAGIVFNFVSFVITLTSFVNRLDNTYVDFVGASTFELKSNVVTMLSECPDVALDFTQNGLTSSTTLNVASVPFVFVTFTNYTLSIIILHGLLVAFDFVAKACYFQNIRHLRIRGVHVPITHGLASMAILLSVVNIVMIAASEGSRDFLQTYITDCAKEFERRDPSLFASTESTTDVVFGTGFILMLVATCVNLSLYFLAAIAYCSDGMRAEVSKITQERFPWEKGFLCKPEKPLLTAYTKWRAEQEQLVKDQQPHAMHPSRAFLDGAAQRQDTERQRALYKQLESNQEARTRPYLPDEEFNGPSYPPHSDRERAYDRGGGRPSRSRRVPRSGAAQAPTAGYGAQPSPDAYEYYDEAADGGYGGGAWTGDHGGQAGGEQADGFDELEPPDEYDDGAAGADLVDPKRRRRSQRDDGTDGRRHRRRRRHRDGAGNGEPQPMYENGAQEIPVIVADG